MKLFFQKFVVCVNVLSNIDFIIKPKKNLEEKQQLRVNLEMKVHDLWNQFNQAMKSYEEITEDRKRTFDDLKEKDEKSAKEIDMQMRKIQSLTVIY